jgi:NADH-quinone oxidoreductase subunit E
MLMKEPSSVVDVTPLLERYSPEDGQSALMSLLQDIQDEHGYLPEAALERTSEHLRVPLSHVYGVVSFYSQFSLTPRGRHIVRMCMGTACHIRGGQMVLDEVRSTLGLQDGKTTEDGLFTVEVVRCLGTCFLAPVMMIDSKYYGMLTPAKVRKIFKSFQEVRS